MVRVLIFLMTPGWISISRMPAALSRAGFQVFTLGPASSPLSQTRHAVAHLAIPPGAHPALPLLNAVRHSQAELIVPGCDKAAIFLHQLMLDPLGEEAGGPPDHLRALVRRSLGDPATWPASLDKFETVAAAHAAGLRTPAHAPVAGNQDIDAFADQYGYPVVLKVGRGAAGYGVRICRSRADVAAGLISLANSYRIRPDRLPVHVQQFIPGRVAMQAVVAMGGDSLEQLGSLKLQCHPGSTGPSSVIRFVEHAGMADAAAAMVRRFGYTGFGSVDFIIDEHDNAWLIEFNPRPTTACSLGHLAGHDLAAALWARMTGTVYTPPAKGPRDVVALFPNELIRDPNSAWVRDTSGTVLHDVPDDDPALLQALREHGRRENPAFPL